MGNAIAGVVVCGLVLLTALKVFEYDLTTGLIAGIAAIALAWVCHE